LQINLYMNNSDGAICDWNFHITETSDRRVAKAICARTRGHKDNVVSLHTHPILPIAASLDFSGQVLLWRSANTELLEPQPILSDIGRKYFKLTADIVTWLPDLPVLLLAQRLQQQLHSVVAHSTLVHEHSSSSSSSSSSALLISPLASASPLASINQHDTLPPTAPLLTSLSLTCVTMDPLDRDVDDTASGSMFQLVHLDLALPSTMRTSSVNISQLLTLYALPLATSSSSSSSSSSSTSDSIPRIYDLSQRGPLVLVAVIANGSKLLLWDTKVYEDGQAMSLQPTTTPTEVTLPDEKAIQTACVVAPREFGNARRTNTRWLLAPYQLATAGVNGSVSLWAVEMRRNTDPSSQYRLHASEVLTIQAHDTPIIELQFASVNRFVSMATVNTDNSLASSRNAPMLGGKTNYVARIWELESCATKFDLEHEILFDSSAAAQRSTSSTSRSSLSHNVPTRRASVDTRKSAFTSRMLSPAASAPNLFLSSSALPPRGFGMLGMPGGLQAVADNLEQVLAAQRPYLAWLPLPNGYHMLATTFQQSLKFHAQCRDAANLYSFGAPWQLLEQASQGRESISLSLTHSLTHTYVSLIALRLSNKHLLPTRNSTTAIVVFSNHFGRNLVGRSSATDLRLHALVCRSVIESNDFQPVGMSCQLLSCQLLSSHANIISVPVATHHTVCVQPTATNLSAPHAFAFVPPQALGAIHLGWPIRSCCFGSIRYRRVPALSRASARFALATDHATTAFGALHQASGHR
jgi:hypothetical protein